jgi:antitoxin CptB
VTSSSEIRRKRLLFRSWHRGTRESDLILGRFADAYLAGFEEAQLERYEVLLDCPDADIFDWVSGRAAPPPEHDHDVIRLLLTFSNAYPHPPSSGGLDPPERSEAGEGTPEE